MAEFKLAPGIEQAGGAASPPERESILPNFGGGASGSEHNDGFDAFAGLSDGFLGTGYSTSTEIAFIVMSLIVVAVVFHTARYLMSERLDEEEYPEDVSLSSE